MVIITGASGFIGRKLVPRLEKRYGKSNIRIVDGDLVTGNGLNEINEKIDLVFHLAANTDTSLSDFRCNDIGTRNLLQKLKGINLNTHFIYVSTAAVFAGRLNCKNMITEKSNTEVNNRYGRSKLEGEKIAEKERSKRKFSLSIVRLGTVYGEGSRKGSFFWLLKKLILKRNIFVSLNWPGKTGFLEVNDASKCLLKIAEFNPGGGVKKYLLCTENLSIAAIIRLVSIQLNVEYRPVQVPSLIWEIFRQLRKFVRYFESILPSWIFNYIWRSSLIVDNVLCCETETAKDLLANKVQKLQDHICQVLE